MPAAAASATQKSSSPSVERIFSYQPCPIVPATFGMQKNNPCGRKQSEQREIKKRLNMNYNKLKSLVANVGAIETAMKIHEQGRTATSEEKEILSR